MEPSFWTDRWQENRIGFHLPKTNPYLSQHVNSIDLHQKSHVMVPLCGKSLDLLWLAERSQKVTGIEVVPQAVEAFFTENKLETSIDTFGEFTRYQHQNIQLLLGDFALEPSQLDPVDIIFDRAALVALPKNMRIAYAEKILALMTPQTKMLLVTLDYPQSARQGPPFAVSETEVMAHYQAHCHIEILQTIDLSDKNDPLSPVALSQETVFLLTLK